MLSTSSPCDIWEPLRSEAGPLQGVRHDQIVQERGVLFPDLVLFIDNSFLHSIIKCGYKKPDLMQYFVKPRVSQT